MEEPTPLAAERAVMRHRSSLPILHSLPPKSVFPSLGQWSYALLVRHLCRMLRPCLLAVLPRISCASNPFLHMSFIHSCTLRITRVLIEVGFTRSDQSTQFTIKSTGFWPTRPQSTTHSLAQASPIQWLRLTQWSKPAQFSAIHSSTTPGAFSSRLGKRH